MSTGSQAGGGPAAGRRRCGAQMIPLAAEEALAAAATVRAPGPGELTAENLPRLLDGAVAALTGWGTPPIGDEVLAARPELGLVAHSAGSVRRLVPPARRSSSRLQVSHAAVNIAESVAEFVIAQTLSILREPHRHDAGMKAGEGAGSTCASGHLGRLLGAQTVGIVGAGYVGRLVIGLFRAFGCRLLVSDPYLTAEKAAGARGRARQPRRRCWPAATSSRCTPRRWRRRGT